MASLVMVPLHRLLGKHHLLAQRNGGVPRAPAHVTDQAYYNINKVIYILYLPIDIPFGCARTPFAVEEFRFEENRL